MRTTSIRTRKIPGRTARIWDIRRRARVTAPVVYAHSGNPEDYEYLRKHGISVRGKIVLVRYSNPYSYRGFKALTAEREGAAAILIYSDPAEDGYTKGACIPMGRGGRRATSSAARSLTISSSRAIR